VVVTVTRVEDYGAYVKLDEYSGTEGLVHISEVSTTWVRNIRDHAREGQKLVLKVLRVNPQRNQIDLSLRRVTGREKSEKMLEWKKERKAEAILKSAAEKMQRPEEDADAVKNTILEKFGSLYDPLEEALDQGPEALVKAGGSGKTIQCATCHGDELKGLGDVPRIAGLQPVYIARQLICIQNGTSAGAAVTPMKKVVANLSEDDIIAISAYLGSLPPQ